MMLIRTVVTWGIGLPITILLFIVVLVSFLFDRSGKAVHSIGAFWSRIMLFLAGVKVEVRGIENIPDAPLILAANHTGSFDIPVLEAWLPLQFRWVAKKGLFNIPIIGWTMRLAGYIPIDVENSAAAYRSIEEAAQKIKNGTSVLIFPEGTRNLKDKLLPFKRGGFLLAQRSEVKIIPVAIKGARDILKIGGFLIRPNRVKVFIGTPIETKGLDEMELKRLTKDAIERGLLEIKD